MATRSTDSETTNQTGSDSDKARHLLAILFSLGRPVRPPELASRSTSFSISSELIHYLCSIPDSPLSLTEDLYVTPSSDALKAFAEYATAISDSTEAVRMWFRKRKRLVSNCKFMPAAKRRLISSLRDGKEENGSPEESECDFPKVHCNMTNYSNCSINVIPSDMTKMTNKLAFNAQLLGNLDAGQLGCELINIENTEDKTTKNVYVRRKVNKETMAREPDTNPAFQTSMVDNLVMCSGDQIDGTDFRNRTNDMATFWPEYISNIALMAAGNASGNWKAKGVRFIGNERIVGVQEEDTTDLNNALLDMQNESVYEQRRWANCEESKDTIPSINKEQTNRHVETLAISPAVEDFVAQKQFSKPSAKIKTIHTTAVSPRMQSLSKSLQHGKAIDTPEERHQCKKDLTGINMVKKSRQNNHSDMHNKRKKTVTASSSAKEQTETKVLPNFEYYVVEEEEGSGGYGTVYRARRKNDGTTVAIKCPHSNAHKHHVNNEMRMLERFGGKNYVIKYEGCFKNGDSDCFVLEHVEHDRPEALKKEIDVLQLQWYGYCMFRALASLHKQGIIHRDVKPGNFLFSRRGNKGYLIDFNLALDLHQKHGNTRKSRVGYDAVKLPNANSVPQTKDRRLPNAKSPETPSLKTTKGYNKSTLDLKNLRKKALTQTKAYNNDLGSWNASKSQGAGGSGITSARDATSTITPSAERLREPLPCQGRKELINLIQEARQSPKDKVSSVPSSMRKRIAAPPRNVDSTLFYLTPMPLHLTGICVGSAGFVKSRGSGKHKKEGPCAGTKGFRAPEVLFRSPYQGPKADIWSAGVTLLYLMIGRTPFIGDPEQNIKEIAKLKGSEDLWEVAKLHNREPSFPVELYKSEFLPSTKLWDWCEMNTKRPDFFKQLPKSLFDLVDKCLTVNPRLRISSEEALKHEFFAPCHESIRKQRLHRQISFLESQNKSSIDQSISKPKISQIQA